MQYYAGGKGLDDLGPSLVDFIIELLLNFGGCCADSSPVSQR